MQLLSENAIVHITAGFTGPFIVQAFAVRHDLYQQDTYHFCITDGNIYIGARYHYSLETELENYYLIQITATFTDRLHPIQVNTLDVVSTSLKKLVGNPPNTLADYLLLQTKNLPPDAPRKMVKTNDMYSSPPVVKSIDGRRAARENSNKAQKEAEREPRPRPAPDHNHRLLRLDSSSEDEVVESIPNGSGSVRSKREEDSGRREESRVERGRNGGGKELVKTGVLGDLYERATGWVILGRVNYMSIVECQNGLFAANFILADETGNEMKCVYFVGQLEQVRQNLIIGSYYLFSGGEVKFSHKDSQLTITFDRNSSIQPQPQAIFAPFEDKFMRIEQVLEREHEEVVNVAGVVRRLKTKEQFKNKTKYTATLCDPLKRLEIDFMLFLNNEEREIERGMVIVLHNFQVFKQQGIFRLNSTFKSYYFRENGYGRQGDLIDQFHQLIEMGEWDAEAPSYRNISMFAFTQRTVADLLELCRRTEDERIYSSLDLWVLELHKKKTYFACRHCKKPAVKKEMSLYECYNCKRMVETIITHAFSVTFADSTANCVIDVIGEHAETLIGMKACDFLEIGERDQNAHLDRLKFKNVLVKLKSENRGEKKSHSVWGIEPPSPYNTLREIEKRRRLHRMIMHENEW